MSVQPETALVAAFCCHYGLKRCCQPVHKVGCYLYESALNYWAFVHDPAEKLTITCQSQRSALHGTCGAQQKVSL